MDDVHVRLVDECAGEGRFRLGNLVARFDSLRVLNLAIAELWLGGVITRTFDARRRFSIPIRRSRALRRS